MNRRRFLITTIATAQTVMVAGCSGSNPNESGFETEGHIDPNIPVDAEEYEKKFPQRPPAGGRKGKSAPTEI